MLAPALGFAPQHVLRFVRATARERAPAVGSLVSLTAQKGALAARAVVLRPVPAAVRKPVPMVAATIAKVLKALKDTVPEQATFAAICR